jgi:hypothetical protein
MERKMDEIPASHVVVSKPSFDSKEPEDIVGSNVEFVNMLLHEHLTLSEISLEALKSYYTDFFEYQIGNGGFSQFTYNSRWNNQTLSLVRSGLEAMGAVRHLALFDAGVNAINLLGESWLERFKHSEYFGENADRDYIEAETQVWMQSCNAEDLIALNANWLRRLPNLAVLSDEDMKALAAHRGRQLPDKPDRINQAIAQEPRYLKITKALCEKAGQRLNRITAGGPGVYEGQRVFECHFLSDVGHHRMIDLGWRAVMLKGTTMVVVSEIIPSENWID